MMIGFSSRQAGCKLRRLLCAAILAAVCWPVAVLGEEDSRATQSPNVIVDKGMRVEFSVEPAYGAMPDEARITEGEYAEVRFRITDAETGAPISPLEPAVWISSGKPNDEISCQARIGRYIQGMLSYQADIDLNKYFLLVMNNDHSISVVDPLMGVSGVTQLYAMIVLKERGEDWTRSADDKRMFVTMPKAGQVAVVNLENFKVLDNLEAGARPGRIAFQPDGRYLWVANDAKDAAESGVTVIDPIEGAIVARIPTGPGHHEIAFSDDSLVAFVTNAAAGSVSVIDTQRLEKATDLEVGGEPISVQFSALSRAAYVAAADGTITAVNGTKREITARVATGAGLRAFRLDPSGRWGFAANATDGRVDVLDTSSGSIAHRIPVGEQPHQFAFTDTYAYVRHLGTPEVALIPLAQLSLKGSPGITTVPIGSRAPGQYAFPAMADSISPTGEWSAVMAANPVDKVVYYYMEGMIAPMGSYSTYGRIPRAVSVVDRSVRETAKGLYTAKFQVPKSGDYDVAFLLDSPWVDHCFSFSADVNPTMVADRRKHPARIEYLTKERSTNVGAPYKLRFSLTGSASEEPLSGLQDVMVMASRTPGWQRRYRAQPLDNGSYEVALAIDEPGAYYVSVAVPSLNVPFNGLPFMTFRAVTDGASKEEK